MSDITRRDALRRLALTFTATGLIDRVAAGEVHEMTSQAAAAAGGAYTPKTFTAAHYRALERLTDLIIPVENGAPGALAAGAPAWIDMISSENDELKASYAKGFAWLDAAMKSRGAADFVLRASGRPDRAPRPHRLSPQRIAGADARDRVLHAPQAHDRRRVLHERDRHQGHRLSRQLADRLVPCADRVDRLCAEEKSARLDGTASAAETDNTVRYRSFLCLALCLAALAAVRAPLVVARADERLLYVASPASATTSSTAASGSSSSTSMTVTSSSGASRPGTCRRPGAAERQGDRRQRQKADIRHHHTRIVAIDAITGKTIWDRENEPAAATA